MAAKERQLLRYSLYWNEKLLEEGSSPLPDTHFPSLVHPSAAAELRSLSVGFLSRQGLLQALDNLSFSLYPGETLVLLGESGCGKSLTSQAMLRLLPNDAGYGQESAIFLQQQDILLLPEHEMRGLRGKRIAMIFQEPMTALNPVFTIGQQLSECLQRAGLPRRERQSRMLQLLREVEMPLPELRLQQYPHQLSGGQKQRVVIAMALAGDPDILLADEPTTALDVTVQAQILRLLQSLQQQRKMTVLLITHDLGVAKAVADRICVMYAGQIVEEASAKDYFHRVQHPYSQLLLQAMPQKKKRGYALSAIEGSVPGLEAMPSGCRFHPRCPYAFAACKTKEPALQEIGTRGVRCHLYPEIQQLPAMQLPEKILAKGDQKKENLLQIRDLQVQYPLPRSWPWQKQQYYRAVEGLSLDIAKGKTLALVGESGCGKTTVGRALMHLLGIAGGTIHFAGQDVTQVRGRALGAYRRAVQIIFQDPFSSMNPRMKIEDILREGMIAQGIPRAEQHRRMQQLLEEVHLPKSILARYPHQFSGGQRQRIAIARALACRPRLLICDEPTSALDVSVQAQLLNLFKSLQQEEGISYLFITHDMAVVSYMADEVLVMQDGKKVEQGSVEQIFEKPQHEYTKLLLRSIL